LGGLLDSGVVGVASVCVAMSGYGGVGVCTGLRESALGSWGAGAVHFARWLRRDALRVLKLKGRQQCMGHLLALRECVSPSALHTVILEAKRDPVFESMRP